MMPAQPNLSSHWATHGNRATRQPGNREDVETRKNCPTKSSQNLPSHRSKLQAASGSMSPVARQEQSFEGYKLMDFWPLGAIFVGHGLASAWKTLVRKSLGVVGKNMNWATTNGIPRFGGYCHRSTYSCTNESCYSHLSFIVITRICKLIHT